MAELTGDTTPAVAALVGGGARAGDELGGYVITALIGAGGMGEVFRARDQRLERDVAIKLVRADDGAEAEQQRARLVREAQAMARLAHENVVTVHEVGVHEGRVYIVMELVEGDTLRAWLRRRPRGVREVLDVLGRAGRGLAAVHAAGLVHRDFKPDNVIVGRDGRVRVADFGLAGGDAGAGAPATTSDGLAVTVAGSTAGTPAYMAPEQHEGRPVDARADQFAFCVTAWEAVCGQRPFAGETLTELRDNLRDGRIVPPPRARMPGWIRAALQRGLMADPARRFPSLDPLLAALARDPAARRRRALLAVALAAAVAALLLVARRGAAPDACGGAPQRLAGAWDDGVRRDVERAFAAGGRPYAADTFRRTAARLDAYARAWSAMHREACEATAVRREQSPALLDQRMACLDHKLNGLRALTELFRGRVDGPLLDRAPDAAGRLEDLGECADPDRLRLQGTLPVDPAARERIRDLERQLAAVRALRLGGRFRDGMAKLQALEPAIEAVDHPYLRMKLLLEKGDLAERVGDDRGAIEARRSIIRAATEARDDYTAAFARLQLMDQIGVVDGRWAEALAMREEAELAVLRAGDTPALRAYLLEALGGSLESKGDLPEAERMLRDAWAFLVAHPDERHDNRERVAGELGLVLKKEGKYPQALVFLQAGLGMRAEVVGPDHPDIAGLHLNIANAFRAQGQPGVALAEYRRVQAIWARAFGPQGRLIALALDNAAHAELDLGLFAPGLADALLGVAIAERGYGAEHWLVAGCLKRSGAALNLLGRHAEAARTLDRTLAMYVHLGMKETTDYGEAVHLRAVADFLAGDAAAALAREEQALAIYAGKVQDDSPELVALLVAKGQFLAAARRWDDALPPLERALAVRVARGGPPADLPEIELALAGVRFHRDRHDADALALAQRAARHFAALGPAWRARAAAAESWIAASGRRG